MRGRTNITPRKEPVINGQIIEATVEANDSISIGDFVEYRTAYSEAANQDYNDVTVIEEQEVGNYKVICLSKNNQCVLELWNKSTRTKNDTLVINSSSSTGLFDKVDNTHLIAYANNLYYYIEISNDTFSIVQTITKSLSPAPTAICVLDSTHFGAFVKQSGSSNYDMNVSLFTFDSSAISFVSTTSFSLGYGNQTRADYVKKVASDRIVIFDPGSSSRSPKMNLLSFNSSYAFTNVEYQNTFTYKQRIRLNDSMLVLLEESTTTTTLNYILHIMKYDSENDVMERYLDLNLSNFFGTFTLTRGQAVISLLNENQITIIGTTNYDLPLTSKKGMNLLYNVSDDSYSTSELIQLANTINYTGVRFAVADSDDAKIMTNTSMISLKIQGNEYEHVPNINYVKSYTGGKAIGFAKTAGVGGETVRIYVPITQ